MTMRFDEKNAQNRNANSKDANKAETRFSPPHKKTGLEKLVNAFLSSGATKEEICAALLNMGYEDGDIEAVLGIAPSSSKKESKKKGKKDGAADSARLEEIIGEISKLREKLLSSGERFSRTALQRIITPQLKSKKYKSSEISLAWSTLTLRDAEREKAGKARRDAETKERERAKRADKERKVREYLEKQQREYEERQRRAQEAERQAKAQEEAQRQAQEEAGKNQDYLSSVSNGADDSQSLEDLFDFNNENESLPEIEPENTNAPNEIPEAAEFSDWENYIDCGDSRLTSYIAGEKNTDLVNSAIGRHFRNITKESNPEARSFKDLNKEGIAKVEEEVNAPRGRGMFNAMWDLAAGRLGTHKNDREYVSKYLDKILASGATREMGNKHWNRSLLGRLAQDYTSAAPFPKKGAFESVSDAVLDIIDNGYDFKKGSFGEDSPHKGLYLYNFIDKRVRERAAGSKPSDASSSASSTLPDSTNSPDVSAGSTNAPNSGNGSTPPGNGSTPPPGNGSTPPPGNGSTPNSGNGSTPPGNGGSQNTPPPYGNGGYWSNGFLNMSSIRKDPVYNEAPASDYKYEASRKRSQGFAEQVYEVYPLVGKNFVDEQAKKRHVETNSAWYDPVRQAMRLPSDNPAEDFATASARLNEFINADPTSRKQKRLRLEASGDAPALGSENATFFERYNPLSRFNLKKRYAKKEFKEAEANYQRNVNDPNAKARRDEAKQEYDYYKRGIKKEFTAEEKDKRAVKHAKDLKKEIDAAFDPKTGSIKPGANLSDEALKLVETKKGETFEKALHRDRNAPKTSEQLFPMSPRWKGRVKKAEGWGNVIGETAGSFFGGAKGGAKGAALLGGAFSGVTKAFGKLHPVLAAVTTAVDLFAKGIKIATAIVQKTMRETFALAPYSGKIGATKAQYSGKEFLRNVRKAREQEDVRSSIVGEVDKLKDSTIGLRLAFQNLWLTIQKVGLKAVTKMTEGAAEVADGVKDTRKAIKENKEVVDKNKRAKKENELINTGNVARYFYETGELADQSVINKSSFAGMSADKIIKELQDPKNRASMEDLIASNDIKRGSGFFQGYEGLNGAEATKNSIQEKILGTLQNQQLIALNTQKEVAATRKASEETAQNTRNNDDNMQNQSIFEAMKSVAGKFATSGAETNRSENGGASYGARAEKQYGRFAGGLRQTEWGRR